MSEQLLRLDRNEGAAATGLEKALESLAAEDLRRYPDATDLERLIAQRHSVHADRVLVTAGADEALDRICRAYLGPEQRAVLLAPAFEMTETYVALSGAEVTRVSWLTGDLPVDAVVDAARQSADVVFVATPANPTGLAASEAALDALAKALPEAIVCVDLAYVEYADADPTQRLLGRGNVVVTRTLSKAWGLAGLRVGYSVASARVSALLRESGGPYSVAAPSLALAAARLTSTSAARDLESSRDRVRSERDALLRAFELAGARATPSQANFVLGRVGDAPFVSSALASLGFAVRTFDRPGLLDAVRVTCPQQEQHTKNVVAAITATLRPEAILLDLDGVLADVRESYRVAIRETVSALGVACTDDAVSAAKRRPGSNNDWEVARRLLADGGRAVALAEVRDCFQAVYERVADKEQLIPDPEVVRRLSARLPLAIVTGRPRIEALAFLERAAVPGCFRTVITVEDAPPKPDPRPVHLALEALGVRSAWMVGDTVDDLAAASAAGVVPIGIPAPGPEAVRDADAETLRQSGAARVLQRLDELLEMLS